MTNELACTDLLVQDNIKDEFHIYRIVTQEFKLPARYRWIFQEQERKLDNNKVSLKEDEPKFIRTGYKDSTGAVLFESIVMPGVYNYINHQIELGVIPKRYAPVTKTICNLKYFRLYYKKRNPADRRTYLYENKLLKYKQSLKSFITKLTKKQGLVLKVKELEVVIERISYREPIISLLIQKNLDKGVIGFFKDLIQRDNGLEFDEYIDKWAKKLMKEHGIN